MRPIGTKVAVVACAAAMWLGLTAHAEARARPELQPASPTALFVDGIKVNPVLILKQRARHGRSRCSTGTLCITY
ncbi:MAG: hypothetical protein AB7S26_31080 [Sandaracinaceae bacterium]